MNIKNKLDIKRIIRSCEGNTNMIIKSIQDILKDNPNGILKIECIEHYLKREEIKEYIMQALNNNDNWIRSIPTIEQYINKDELIEKCLMIYKKSPRSFYAYSNFFESLFSDEYFQNYAQQNKSTFFDDNIGKIFLLFHANDKLGSFDGIINTVITKVTQQAKKNVEVEVLGSIEAGTACGGMEKNYLEAVKKGEGICLVNNIFLAKFYHRKGEAKKVSYLPCENYISTDNHIIWKDFFYASSGGQHNLVIEAIKRGENNITIKDLQIKTVRPCIGITSESIVKQLPSDLQDDIL